MDLELVFIKEPYNLLKSRPSIRLKDESVLSQLLQNPRRSILSFRRWQHLAIVPNQPSDLRKRSMEVGNLASNELPNDDPVAIHVGGLFVLASPQDLRGHPVGSAYPPLLVLHIDVAYSGQPEVTNFDRPVVLDQNILAF